MTAGDAEQAVLEWGVVGHVHREQEHPGRSPLLGMGADLLPNPLDQLRGQIRIDTDDAGDVVHPQPTEGVDLPEVLIPG